MPTEVISKIWDYLFNLFGHHDTENPEKFSKQVQWQSIVLIVIAIVLGITLSVLIYRVGINKIPLVNEVKNGEEILYKPTSLAWGMIVTILLFVWTVCAYAYGVLKDLKPTIAKNIISEPIKESLQNDVSFLQLKQCAQCSNYFLSSSFIIDRIEQLTSHSDFVKICFSLSQKKVSPQDLLEIKNYFKRNNPCKLLCLLTNPQYYTPNTDKNNLIDLLQYFESFYPLQEDGKRIKRVFNLSAIGKSDEPNYNEKKEWLFQYVLMNVLTGVETCVLDDTNDDQLHHLTIDYVIGMETDKNTRLYSKRKLFLSYQETDKDQVLIFEDQLLTNVFEADFYDRLKNNPNSGGYSSVRSRVIIEKKDKDKINDNDIDEIYNLLGLSGEKMISCVDNMIKVIDGSHSSFKSKNSPLKPLYIGDEFKKKLLDNLNDIKGIINKGKYEILQ